MLVVVRAEDFHQGQWVLTCELSDRRQRSQRSMGLSGAMLRRLRCLVSGLRGQRLERLFAGARCRRGSLINVCVSLHSPKQSISQDNKLTLAARHDKVLASATKT